VNKQEQLVALEHVITQNEIRIRTAQINIDALSRDIETLANVEGLLIENIRFLKKAKIIAKADDYRKAKEELAKTTIRVVALMNDRETLRKDVRVTEKSMSDAKEKIEKLQGDPNNVIPWRRKDGQN